MLDNYSSIGMLCGARDYHAYDWYISAKANFKNKEVFILTDLIGGEGFKKIIGNGDIVYPLLIIDNILIANQSRRGDIWRNFVKMIVLPIQVFLICVFNVKKKNAIYQAHSMYYIWLAYFSRIKFIATPQGSDILVKPHISKIYKYLSRISLKKALMINVDSQHMQEAIHSLYNLSSVVVQNGIDINSISKMIIQPATINRDKVVSIRAITELYQVDKILQSRNCGQHSHQPIEFVYPFMDGQYMNDIRGLFIKEDIDHGRLPKNKLFKLLICTKLVISIPSSDSSPRSVYEAIFCGAIVAMNYNPYYDVLPNSMKSRIILVDFSVETWFDEVMIKADQKCSMMFKPCDIAYHQFNQLTSFSRMINKMAGER